MSEQTTRTVYKNYPGIPNLIDYSYKINGELALVEMILDYDGDRINVCEIVDFEARVASAVGRKALDASRRVPCLHTGLASTR